MGVKINKFRVPNPKMDISPLKYQPTAIYTRQPGIYYLWKTVINYQ